MGKKLSKRELRLQVVKLANRLKATKKVDIFLTMFQAGTINLSIYPKGSTSTADKVEYSWRYDISLRELFQELNLPKKLVYKYEHLK